MGEMTIRGIDENTLAALKEEAERRGMDPSELARLLLRSALPGGPDDRTAVARSVLASQSTLSPVSSVELLKQLRNDVR